MPHAGMTPDQLWAIGADTPERIAHSLETQDNSGDAAVELADMIISCNADPEGPGCAELYEAHPEFDSEGVDGGPLEDTSTTTITDRNVDVDSTSQKIIDSLTKETQEIFFTVPTAEQFLNDFETSFSAFAKNAATAGLGDSDIERMLDPQSGFLSQMFGQYIAEIAQRALDGEDPFVLQGQDGQTPISIGERIGETTTRETDQTTISTEDQETTIDESTESTTVSGDESQTNDQDSSLTEDLSSTSEDSLSATDVTTTQEDLFQRDAIAPIFKHTPTAFLLSIFGEDLGERDPADVEKAFIGVLSTQIRAAAPKRRPGGGNVNIGGSISARRT